MAFLHPGHSHSHLRTEHIRRQSNLRLMADDKDAYDWDAAWQQATAERRVLLQREAPEPATSGQPNVPAAVQDFKDRVTDVRRWRLPFGFFQWMVKADFFGTSLSISSLAWVLFYLVFVPATPVLGPVLGLPDMSGLDTQTIARVVSVPGLLASYVVSAGLVLGLRRGG